MRGEGVGERNGVGSGADGRGFQLGPVCGASASQWGASRVLCRVHHCADALERKPPRNQGWAGPLLTHGCALVRASCAWTRAPLSGLCACSSRTSRARPPERHALLACMLRARAVMADSVGSRRPLVTQRLLGRYYEVVEGLPAYLERILPAHARQPIQEAFEGPITADLAGLRESTVGICLQGRDPARAWSKWCVPTPEDAQSGGTMAEVSGDARRAPPAIPSLNVYAARPAGADHDSSCKAGRKVVGIQHAHPWLSRGR